MERGLASATIALAAAALTGCATEPLSLDIREQPAGAAEKIPHTVVFVHSKQMREEIQAVPGNVSLRIGEASDRALRSAYAQGFVETREVSSLEEFRSQSGAQTAIALLQPEIIGFQTVSMSPQLNGPFVAEIIYRFRLFNSAGAQAGAWEMHSLGTYDPEQARREHSADFRPDSRMWVAEAPRRAIEAAPARLLAGFDSVPELMRLKRGLPLEDTNVPSERQQPGATISTAAKQGRYPGALTVTVNTDVLPRHRAGLGRGHSQA